MKRAILYTRVSTDDQADRGYSLRDQEARLRGYCDRAGHAVEAHFQDDHSAKTFDRPAWNQLLARLQADPLSVELVLVVKWDRFSRDATGALSMIRTLEELGIEVQAIEQPIDRSVPEQLMMLAIYVAAPEVENRRRSLATKQGMRRAMREGRYINVPPKGYQRGYDEAGKYLIEPGDDAAFVREAFRMAATTGLSMEEIRKRLVKRGFKCSKNQFTLLLRNPLYAGKILISAWRGEPEVVVQGAHEPLVDESTFEKVQERFEKKTVRHRRVLPELPLRGHLLDPETLVPLTGSGSRSRAGHRLWYYHGQGKGAYRVRADAAHDAFADHLNEIEFAPDVAALYRAMAGEMDNAERQTRARHKQQAREDLQRLEAKLLVIDERYIDGDLERDSYQRLKEKYIRRLTTLRVRVSETSGAREGLARRVEFAVDMMGRLGAIWRKGSVEVRDALVGSIWPAGLIFDGESYRTTEQSALIALFRGETQKTRDADPSKEIGVLCGSPGRTRTYFM